MDLESEVSEEWSKSEKEKYCIISLICGIKKEIREMNL